MKKCNTAAEAINALGGPKRFAEWCGGGVTRKRASHWKYHGFPASTYEPLSRRLNAAKLEVAASAWNMREGPLVPPRAERLTAAE